jgi:plasmid stabilization system protein ParE
MKKYRVRLARGAERDLLQLHAYLLQRDPSAARRAGKALRAAMRVLATFPFTCRKQEAANDPTLRELLVPFGSAGYVLLFEIEDSRTVTILAARHQREDDYH